MTVRIPRVSVIIPTHDRVSCVMRTLRGLDAQTFPADQMELVVVADACTDSSAASVRGHRSSFPTLVVEQKCGGPGAARNAGALHARGPLFLFLDDDVEPKPNLVQAHVQAHEGRSRIAVMGPYPPSLRGRSSFFRMAVRNWWNGVFIEMGRPGHRFRYRDLISGNLSIASGLFEELGGFDETVGGAHEDYELGVRLIKAGVQFVYVPAAIGWHHEHETMTMAGSFRRAKKEGHADVIIGRLHPEVRFDLFGAFEDSEDGYYRRLRYLLFLRPWLGKALARLAVGVLAILEGLRMRHRWRGLYGALFNYWYWRGVAEEIGSESALSRYVECAPVKPEATEENLVIDLTDGLQPAEARLDAERPAGVSLRFGLQELGRIEPVRLAEPLRGAHLRPILAERFTWQTLQALAVRETALASVRSLSSGDI